MGQVYTSLLHVGPSYVRILSHPCVCPLYVYISSIWMSFPCVHSTIYISLCIFVFLCVFPIRVYVIRCSKCISPLYGCHFRVRIPLCIGPSMHISLCLFVCLFFSMYFPSACMSFPYGHSTECMFPFRVSLLIGSQETKPLHSPR